MHTALNKRFKLWIHRLYNIKHNTTQILLLIATQTVSVKEQDVIKTPLSSYFDEENETRWYQFVPDLKAARDRVCVQQTCVRYNNT